MRKEMFVESYANNKMYILNFWSHLRSFDLTLTLDFRESTLFPCQLTELCPLSDETGTMRRKILERKNEFSKNLAFCQVSCSVDTGQEREAD